ncbi:NAD-dependent epimerase/dehydratase family protein [Aliarcobacter butzleri]|uniref:NAD-dependent epimerase/dehydratase family protein n=1 Tax=Aliarcobacter butzleri TaxID=28197 RepID=UPI001EDC0AA0|nr:NAD-dependent epimerase/dehydratase family protein [Aliarcobacter butzleri]MCG3701756.1 NAD-dependent epimerase/dehydratase family protein [Aliarcobacter butzleri]MCG3703959.1 NAD-dependent epimerase/dehydratase family protein [Aliarcobacter butzleri]
MNILITGSAGFIASHLIEELLKDQNNCILGIDNFYSGTKENLEFIKSIDSKNKFQFIQSDIRNFEEINKIIRYKKIEYIYHLAAIVSVQESILNPLLSNEVNVKGTLNILESAKLNNVKRVVFSSSAAVYGNEPTQPKNEISQTKPISPYGYEKLIGEQYMKLYSELYGVETVSLRYFNVYGERQRATSDYSGVISIFEKKFKNNEIPNIYGDGEQYRDFVYVKDVVKLNIKAMNIPNISGKLFCVGTSKKVSINDLVSILNYKYSKNIKANYLESRNGDIKESICDNKKIKQFLEFESFISFEEGILKL